MAKVMYVVITAAKVVIAVIIDPISLYRAKGMRINTHPFVIPFSHSAALSAVSYILAMVFSSSFADTAKDPSVSFSTT